MDVTRYLICTGDPILDIYYIGNKTSNNFHTEKIVRSHGGALNVWKNIESIVGKDNVHYVSPIYLRNKQMYLTNTIDLYTVHRFIDESEDLVFESTNALKSKKHLFYKSKRKTRTRVSLEMCHLEQAEIKTWKGLVVSEYNKGCYNYSFRRTSDGLYQQNYMPEFDFCVIDSKYRTIDLGLLATSKVKIWHATGLEYSKFFARNFHFTIRTDGPSKVRIYSSDGEEISGNDPRLEVPNTPIVNTCGAGDTFTAAVSSYLLYQNKVNLETLIQASEFAIKCCQDVIKTKYTTATTVTLE